MALFSHYYANSPNQIGHKNEMKTANMRVGVDWQTIIKKTIDINVILIIQKSNTVFPIITTFFNRSQSAMKWVFMLRLI